MASPLLYWTPARIAKLFALKAEGLNARAIGERMGVTRNAVLGAVYRSRHPEEGMARVQKPRSVRAVSDGPVQVWAAWGLESEDRLRRAIWARARKGARAARRANA